MRASVLPASGHVIWRAQPNVPGFGWGEGNQNMLGKRDNLRSIVVNGVLAGVVLAAAAGHAQTAPSQFDEFTIAQFQEAMAAGTLTSRALTDYYIDRIINLDQNGPGVNSVIELNPDARTLAQNADALRASGLVLGPLTGNPVRVTDDCETPD